jgi:hypothetical protein
VNRTTETWDGSGPNYSFSLFVTPVSRHETALGQLLSRARSTMYLRSIWVTDMTKVYNSARATTPHPREVGLRANIYRDDDQSQKFLKTFDESYASLAPISKPPNASSDTARGTMPAIFSNVRTQTTSKSNATSSRKLLRQWSVSSTRRRWRCKDAPRNV